VKTQLYILLFLFAVAIILSCKKNTSSSNIPNIAVNITVTPNDPAYNRLQVPGGWLYITGGSQGIVIYRVSDSEFNAFDRHSTYKPENNCRVQIDNTQVTAVDSCSGSKWVITDGSNLNGPATTPLKKYTTTWDGYSLRITN